MNGTRKKRTTPSIVDVKLTGKQLIDAIVEHFYCYAANEFEKQYQWISWKYLKYTLRDLDILTFFDYAAIRNIPSQDAMNSTFRDTIHCEIYRTIANRREVTVELKDVTDEFICLGIFGPKSRDLLSKITKEDLSNENFKFATGKNINLKSIDVWVQRLSYVG